MRLRVLLVAGCAVVSLLGSSVVAEAVPAQASITKAEAKKLAKAGVLTKTDVAGYKAAKQKADPSDAEGEAALYACLGKTPPKYLAKNPGMAFTKGPAEIDSSTSVVDTGKHAKADLKLFATQAAADCYAQELQKAFEAEGMTIDNASVKLVTVKVSGAKAAFAYKYDITATLQGVPVRLRGFDVNSLVGQTEIAISSIRFDGKLPKLGQAATLAGIVAKRVAAV